MIERRATGTPACQGNSRSETGHRTHSGVTGLVTGVKKGLKIHNCGQLMVTSGRGRWLPYCSVPDDASCCGALALAAAVAAAVAAASKADAALPPVQPHTTVAAATHLRRA